MWSQAMHQPVNLSQSDSPSRFYSGVWARDSEGGISRVGERSNAMGFSHTLVNSPSGIASYNAAALAHHADGNYIRGGSKIRDDVLILGMDGEFIVRKDAAEYYGPRMLHDLNSKRLKRMAEGGYTNSPVQSKDAGGNLVLSMPINIQSGSADTPESAQKKRDQAAQLQPLFRAAIMEVIIDQKRPGGILH
jgi:hypothetical protein